jgi:hypothetical protein
MRFISLSKLKKITIQVGDPTNLSERAKIENYITSHATDFEETDYSASDILAILQLLNEQTIVFFQWIEQDKELLNILEGKLPRTIFQDHFHWIGHSLSVPFFEFLLLFLKPAALKYQNEENTETVKFIFSYLQLMSSEERLMVEQELFTFTQQRMKILFNNAREATSEAQLLTITEVLCKDDYITIIGYLSRSSYHTKVWYVDEVLKLFRHPSISARLAYRIIQKLKQLELNPEHESAISAIEKELTSGQMLNEQKKNVRSFSFKLKKVVPLILLFAVLSSVYFIINYKETVDTDNDLHLASSFEQFSKEERKQIDSLIRSQRNDSLFTDQNQDQYLWVPGTSVSLSIRKPLKNERMEELYSDWLLDAQLFEKGIIDTCQSNSDSKKYQFKDVLLGSDLKGDQSVAIRNESDYSIYIFVFDEKKEGEIYSVLLEKDKSISLDLTLNQHLLFVAGNNLTKFIKPNGLGAGELPSNRFDHHFCASDQNLSISLNSLYILKYPHKKANKLLISGDKQSTFVVADLYGILETF